MMKRSILKKLLCAFSLIMLVGLVQVPAQAANLVYLWANSSDTNPETGDTVTVTISMSGTFDSSDTQLLVGLTSSKASILQVTAVNPLITAFASSPADLTGGPETKDAPSVSYAYNSSNVWMMYQNSAGLSGIDNGAILQVTFKVNPDLATGGTIVLTPYYATGNAANPIYTSGGSISQNIKPTYFSPITISYVATATGEGYYVFLNANGGDLSADALRTNSEGKLSALPTPTRDGYIFDGWYTEISGGEKVTAQTIFSEDTNIYAHWTIDSSQEENNTGGSTMGDAVTLGIAGSIISVFIYLLILLLV